MIQTSLLKFNGESFFYCDPCETVRDTASQCFVLLRSFAIAHRRSSARLLLVVNLVFTSSNLGDI